MIKDLASSTHAKMSECSDDVTIYSKEYTDIQQSRQHGESLSQTHHDISRYDKHKIPRRRRRKGTSKTEYKHTKEGALPCDDKKNGKKDTREVGVDIPGISGLLQQRHTGSAYSGILADLRLSSQVFKENDDKRLMSGVSDNINKKIDGSKSDEEVLDDQDVNQMRSHRFDDLLKRPRSLSHPRQRIQQVPLVLDLGPDPPFTTPHAPVTLLKKSFAQVIKKANTTTQETANTKDSTVEDDTCNITDGSSASSVPSNDESDDNSSISKDTIPEDSVIIQLDDPAEDDVRPVQVSFANDGKKEDSDDDDFRSRKVSTRRRGFSQSDSVKRVKWDGNLSSADVDNVMKDGGGWQGDGWQSKSKLEPKPLFVQLDELDRNEMGGQQREVLSEEAHWKPMARWIKFEENWEDGADRWSKPHVASLTFNSLPQLRKSLENGVILLDIEQTKLQSIFNCLAIRLVDERLIEPEQKPAIMNMLQLTGTGCKPIDDGKNERFFQISRRISSNLRGRVSSNTHGRVSSSLPFSLPGNHGNDSNSPEDQSNMEPEKPPDLQKFSNSVFLSMLGDQRSTNNSNSTSTNNNHSATQNVREGILRMLPENAEGAIALTAMDDTLKSPVAAFIRLGTPQVFDDLLEAPVPLRFIFFLVGPDYINVDYREVGRAMATLFTDEVFRDKAYAAATETEVLYGINEFLNDTTVLPPGDWDRELLLPITRKNHMKEQMKTHRRETQDPSKMALDTFAIMKMMEADQLNVADPLTRTGRLFGGLINDVKRRYRHYKSDITDAFNFQCLAAFVFLYFACLSPAIAFGGLIGDKTENWMGVTEMIISTSLCGMLFAVFGGQPLIILGGTGPVLFFESFLYEFCKDNDIEFMAFRAWIGFWICILATIVVAVEGSVLVRYFTRFTEEIFSTVISMIFIYKAYTGIEHIICANPILDDYCVEEVYTTITETVLNGSQLYDPSHTMTGYHVEEDHSTGHHVESRGAPGYATDHATNVDPFHSNLTAVLEDGHGNGSDHGGYHGSDHHGDDHHGGGHHGCFPLPDPHPNSALFAIILTLGTCLLAFFLRYFRTSQFLGRTARRGLSSFGVAIAILTMVTFAHLASDMIYYDTIKISPGLKPTDPTKRGWLINPMGDKKTMHIGAIFCAIIPAFLVFILLYMEILLNGMSVDKEQNHLEKGTGYHLDLFIMGVVSAIAGLMGIPWMCAAPIRTVSHIGSLTVLTRSLAPGVKPKLDHIKDQRVTNFAVSLLIGLSNFMAPLLGAIPIATLLGVFLYLGITSLGDLQFIERLKIVFLPQKHHPDVMYVRMVKFWRMHMYTAIQFVCLISLWMIKNSILALGFPFFLILLIFVRKLLSLIFTKSELEALDCEEEDEEDTHTFDQDI